MFSISLRADSISKTYGKGLLSQGRCIFQDVSFDIRPGETFGLMGPSGEGKSTLGRVIAGLEKPTHGTVYYKSSPLSEMKKTEHMAFRRKVQIMFQDPTGALMVNLYLIDIIYLKIVYLYYGKTRSKTTVH